MDEQDKDVVVPVIREEVHADAVPVVTGGVRVTKRLESHDETVEQELQKSRVEVKRVKTDRVVDGPQPARRVGNTLIVPVVSEVLRIEKQWVVTEEIHLTEVEQRETVQNKVTLNSEEAQVERVDSAGNVISSVEQADERASEASKPASILQRKAAAGGASKKKGLSHHRSLVTERKRETD